MIQANTIFFMVDIETSGPVPGFFNMISLGAVEVRPQNGKLEPGRDFYIEIRPDFDGFDPEAEQIHGLSLAHLQEHGKDSREALRAFDSWTRSCLEPGEKPVFVAHNAPFDWSFITYYFHYVGLENPFGYKALDTKALAMGKLGWPWWETNKEQLQERYPHMNEPPAHLVHRADVDARYQAEILCALLNEEEATD